MAFRRSFRPRGRSGGKRAFLWTLAATDGVTNIPAGGIVSLTVFTIGDASMDYTLFRLRGFLSISANAAGFQQYWGAAGIIKLQDKQAGVGTTAIPGPFVNGDYDWIWHNGWSFSQNGTLEHHDFQMTVDGKARRKFDDNEQCALVLENQSTVDVGLNYYVRALLSKSGRA